jgi:hypothetical protein
MLRADSFADIALLPLAAQLFAVGVHFVVVLAVAHTVLLREQLLGL